MKETKAQQEITFVVCQTTSDHHSLFKLCKQLSRLGRLLIVDFLTFWLVSESRRVRGGTSGSLSHSGIVGRTLKRPAQVAFPCPGITSEILKSIPLGHEETAALHWLCPLPQVRRTRDEQIEATTCGPHFGRRPICRCGIRWHWSTNQTETSGVRLCSTKLT